MATARSCMFITTLLCRLGGTLQQSAPFGNSPAYVKQVTEQRELTRRLPHVTPMPFHMPYRCGPFPCREHGDCFRTLRFVEQCRLPKPRHSNLLELEKLALVRQRGKWIGARPETRATLCTQCRQSTTTVTLTTLTPSAFVPARSTLLRPWRNYLHDIPSFLGRYFPCTD